MRCQGHVAHGTSQLYHSVSVSTRFTQPRASGVTVNLFRSANLFRRNLFASRFVPDFQEISEFVPDGQRSVIL